MDQEGAAYLRPSAHADSFARDGLPPLAAWPVMHYDLPSLQYPDRLNCAAELIDRHVAKAAAKISPCLGPVGCAGATRSWRCR